jgi:hypothetical protein
MDEISLLAKALPDAPPPTSQVTARAHARLAAATARADARLRPRPMAGRFRGGWAWAVGTAIATASVITAVTLIATGLGVTPGPAAQPAEPSLRDIAERVAALTPATGAYWRQKATSGAVTEIDTGPTPYLLHSSTEEVHWVPRDPQVAGLQESRVVAPRPARPQDEQAWRAAGSPTEWRVPKDCLAREGCKPAVLSVERAACVYTRQPSRTLPGGLLDDLTFADVDAMPADPPGLREALRPYHTALVERGLTQSFEAFLGDAGMSLLPMPISPALRAATLRMLAELPGTRVLGETVDPIGRPGIAVEIAGTGGAEEKTSGDETTSAAQFVIDRQTGELLAQQEVTVRDLALAPTGTVLSSVTYEQEWTDRQPAPSPGCSPDGS